MANCCSDTNEACAVSVDISSPAGRPPESRTYFVAGDAGLPGEEQDALAERRLLSNPRASIFLGDNVYQPHSAAEAWDALLSQDGIGPIHPVWGNHDHDVGLDDQLELFPGRGRYYHRDLGVADLFVLNSGLNTAAEVVEPDGIEVGSTQYQWFVSALTASRRPWKVVAFHHPFVTQADNGDNRALPAMDWAFEDLGVDLVLNGHTHTGQIGLFAGAMLIADFSSGVREMRAISPDGSVYGSRTDYYQSLWASDEKRAYGELVMSSYRMTLRARDLSNGDILFQIVRAR